MQVDEGAPAEKQHLDLSMTKRLFSQLNGDLNPSAADFQREFDILLTSERKVASVLLGALKSVSDQQQGDRLCRVIRSASLTTSPASFYEPVFAEHSAGASTDAAKHAFNVLKSLI